MPLSLFALTIALTCYLLGIPLLLTEKKALAWHKKFHGKGNEHLVSLVGGFFVIVSALALRANWSVTPDGEGFVVLVAWLSLLKGLFMAWQPLRINRIVLDLLSRESFDLLLGFLLIIWGALFLYLSYAIPL